MSAKYKLLILEGGGFFGLLDARIRGGYVTVAEAEVILGCLRRANGSTK